MMEILKTGKQGSVKPVACEYHQIVGINPTRTYS